MKIMEKTTTEQPRCKSRKQIRKEVGRGTKHRHESVQIQEQQLWEDRQELGSAVIWHLFRLLIYFIYCIYLIVIQLFYIYALHSDCVSSHIIEQMLPMYAQTDHAK
jgi:hypothetical protein